MALIEFRDVRKAFGPKVVYRGLSLEVRRGEALTVIGGSGQGKSVMLKMLVGLLPVDSGSVSFDGTVISDLDERGFSKVRRRIGMLFQGAALFDSLSVGENVAFGLREIGERDEGAIAERVAESLGYVGLEGSEDLWPADLSGGMKKRVGLARAIAVRPEVLLYDEPTTGLDPVNIARITDLIQHLQRTLDVTSIVVTHDMPSAFRVSDRIAMIQDGTVIFSGVPKQLATSDDPRVRDFVEGNAPENEDASVILGGTA
ncbi:MAG: ABC transporter ATP-binding protein [Sandaracinus sp.]|nr:ABC transporter ATP-binding protein [Sandaracinus sp.]MCB9618463.1 ABC transporter ATP-binding protein [Sandaracinus sp.]